MDYQQTLAFLYKQLPYFTRDGAAAIKNNLNNTLALSAADGDPHKQFKTIHIAGTNGKGSVSNMLAAIFQEHGYKTGLYTSPHLKDFRERIRINGEMVPEDFVVDYVEKSIPILEETKASFFELTVAMCFAYFAKEKVDVAIIETGMGGRLDSTNIIHPEISVITNIGLDHADLLGNTLELIASEKAGIIKQNIPVVIGESQVETDAVFKNKAISTGSEIYFADHNINYYNTEIDTDLLGTYQQKNCVTALQTVDVLIKNGWPLNHFTSAKALMHVKDLTQFRGRWEIVASNPKTIADTGHNAHGLAITMRDILSEKFQTLHMVIGLLQDKDRKSILELLPHEAIYYFCSPALPRALDASLLKEEALNYNLKGNAYKSVQDALDTARKNAAEDDLIFVGGSTFVVAEIL